MDCLPDNIEVTFCQSVCLSVLSVCLSCLSVCLSEGIERYAARSTMRRGMPM